MDIPDFQPQQPNVNTAPIINEGKTLKLKKYLPIGIGALISVVILVLAFGVLQNFFTRASGEIPQNVVVSELTENQAKITWNTDVETQGLVNYGTSPNTLSFPAPETIRTQQHSVALTLLSPGTTYYFDIQVGDKKYDNGGIPWTFTTKEIQKTQPSTIQTEPTAIEEVEDTTPTPTIEEDRTCEATTDCEAIKAKLGKGCTTQDYFKCVKAATPTP